MENGTEKAIWTWTKGMKSPNPAGRKIEKPRTRANKSAAMLSLVRRVLKNKYTAERLDELLEGLSKRDQAMFYMHYVRPPQPAQPKDAIDALNSQQVDELYRKIMNNAK